MIIRRPANCPLRDAEVTPRSIYYSRRQLLTAALNAAAIGIGLPATAAFGAQLPVTGAVRALPDQDRPQEPLTPLEFVTGYNNFYEFGTDKSDPAANAGSLLTRPWTVAIEGEVNNPAQLDIDALLAPQELQERVYRLRCVEGWSMVIPWIGFPLGDLIKRFELRGNAKYVEFTTLHDPRQMPGQQRAVLDWPYREGLRLDEAMHPLTLLAVGLYGEVLPNQNGAPLRLVVPWKYGFKSIKSIVRIRFTEAEPATSWNLSAPQEYGFYSNVNPEVAHPRWSQAKERRLGEGGPFSPKRKTLPFNGYAEQVAGMYSGMDPRKYF